MINTSNKNARVLIQDKQEFKGSHTFGQWEGNFYKVYSYGFHFPLFGFNSLTGQWYANTEKYSRTTSKQAGQLRPFITGEFIGVNTQELKELTA